MSISTPSSFSYAISVTARYVLVSTRGSFDSVDQIVRYHSSVAFTARCCGRRCALVDMQATLPDLMEWEARFLAGRMINPLSIEPRLRLAVVDGPDSPCRSIEAALGDHHVMYRVFDAFNPAEEWLMR